MREVRCTDWYVNELDAAGNFDANHIYIEPAIAVIERKIEGRDQDDMRNAILISEAENMLKALRRAVLALAFAAERSSAMHDDYKAVSNAIERATRGEP